MPSISIQPPALKISRMLGEIIPFSDAIHMAKSSYFVRLLLEIIDGNRIIPSATSNAYSSLERDEIMVIMDDCERYQQLPSG